MLDKKLTLASLLCKPFQYSLIALRILRREAPIVFRFADNLISPLKRFAWSFLQRRTMDSLGAIHSTKISGNFGPKLNGLVRSNRKSFEKTCPPFEVDRFTYINKTPLWKRYKAGPYTYTNQTCQRYTHTQMQRYKLHTHIFWTVVLSCMHCTYMSRYLAQPWNLHEDSLWAKEHYPPDNVVVVVRSKVQTMNDEASSIYGYTCMFISKANSKFFWQKFTLSRDTRADANT